MRPRLEQLQQHLSDPEALQRGIAQREPQPEERALTAGRVAIDGAVPGEADAVAGLASLCRCSRRPLPRRRIAAGPSRQAGGAASSRLVRRGIPTVENLTRFGTRLRRRDRGHRLLHRAPLGWREGAIVVWAGMRGAVTVAAAQSLPQRHPRAGPCSC